MVKLLLPPLRGKHRLSILDKGRCFPWRHMPVVATCLNVFSVILSVCGRAKVSVLILWHVFRMGMCRLMVSPNRLAEDLK